MSVTVEVHHRDHYHKNVATHQAPEVAYDFMEVVRCLTPDRKVS
jgi:hypothetical protein